MYVRVYSLDGEAFDVNRHVADDLILQKGWTQTPPTFTEKKETLEPKAKPKAKSRKKKAAEFMPFDEAFLEASIENAARSSSDE
jgi:hypothetical protein